jgi:hypothetical protein
MSQLLDHVHTNGTRGRAVPALPEHTFRDSGITIKIRKVGPSTQQRIAQAIMKEMPEPSVPIVKTELGDEPNAADPAYLLAKAEWDQATNQELARRTMLIAALEAEVTIDDAARANIARKQRNMRLAGAAYEPNADLTSEENEKVFYILHVAAATPEDLREFSAAVMRRSMPTEEAVQSQIATFQRDVQE